MSNSVEVSAVIPVIDRVDDLAELCSAYEAVLVGTGRSYEIILVLDGGAASFAEVARQICEESPKTRIVQLSKYFGEATTLSAGFDNAQGDLMLTLPAYYQVDPAEIAKLFEAIDSADIVLARRWPRAGSGFERLRRSAFHFLLRILSGEKYTDLGCGVRLFKRQVSDEVNLYGDLHRFLPVLANQQGFAAREVDLRQSEKDSFRGRYRLREYLHRVLDIFTVFFLVRFTKKPLRFFGMIGGISVGVGGIVVLVTVIQRLFFDIGLADRPALLLGSLLLVLGVQTIALGLIGELIIFTHAGSLKEYKVAEIINPGSARG